MYEERLPKVTNKEAPLSIMEKNDLLELSKVVTDKLTRINVVDNEDIEAIDVMENELKEVFKKHTVINDQPIKKKVANWYVEPLRYKNRLQLLNIYEIIRLKKAKLKEVLD